MREVGLLILSSPVPLRGRRAGRGVFERVRVAPLRSMVTGGFGVVGVVASGVVSLSS